MNEKEKNSGDRGRLAQIQNHVSANREQIYVDIDVTNIDIDVCIAIADDHNHNNEDHNQNYYDFDDKRQILTVWRGTLRHRGRLWRRWCPCSSLRHTWISSSLLLASLLLA